MAQKQFHCSPSLSLVCGQLLTPCGNGVFAPTFANASVCVHNAWLSSIDLLGMRLRVDYLGWTSTERWRLKLIYTWLPTQMPRNLLILWSTSWKMRGFGGDHGGWINIERVISVCGFGFGSVRFVPLRGMNMFSACVQHISSCIILSPLSLTYNHIYCMCVSLSWMDFVSFRGQHISCCPIFSSVPRCFAGIFNTLYDHFSCYWHWITPIN